MTPALKALVREAITSNPGVEAAAAALDRARARARAADRPLYNPSLELDAENAESRTRWAGLRQTVDWADKRGARTRAARFSVDAAAADLAAARQRVAGELLAALAQVRTQTALEALARERVALMRRFAAVAERRRRAGDLGEADRQLARLALIRAKLELAQASADRVQARQALTAVLGRVPPAPPRLPVRLPALTVGRVDLDGILNSLPRLHVLQARTAAARATVALRRRERRPDPTFGVRGGRENSTALVGLTISIPLYLRNTFRAEVEAAGAEEIRAARTAQDAYRRARSRLRSALESYRAARDAWQTWEASGAETLRRRTALLERLWQSGELGATDYLVQLNQTLDTRGVALQVRGRLWRSWVEWLVASGNVLDELGVAPPRRAGNALSLDSGRPRS